MFFTTEENCGHASLMFDRLARLHTSMRERGASEGAIARLPKLPVRAKPIDLPPIVLATRKNGTDYVTQERLRKVREPGYIKPVYPHKAKAALKRYKTLGYEPTFYKGDTTPEQLQRAVDIIDVTAVAGGISPWRIRSKGKPADVVPVRQVAIKLALELTRLTATRLAPVFETEHSTIRHNHRRARLLLDLRDEKATGIYAAALAECTRRWPEYRKEAA